MVEAKLLRKKLKNGLIVDKWDLVTIIEKQQAEIDRLKALCISYIDEEWSGTSSYQTKIDEVNGKAQEK